MSTARCAISDRRKLIIEGAGKRRERADMLLAAVFALVVQPEFRTK